MYEVTFLITSFERQGLLLNCVNSVRGKYPESPILVVDDSEKFELKTKLNEIGADLIQMPFDSGVSAKRNLGFREAGTKFVMLLEDDYEFYEKSNIEDLKIILESDEKIDIAAGALAYDNEPYLKKLGDNIEIDHTNKLFRTVSIFNPKWHQAKGVRYHFAEYFFNFFLARNSMPLKWEETYKIGIEHMDFCLKAKERGIRAVNVPTVITKHLHGFPSKKYYAYRTRHEYWKKFNKDTGYTTGVFGGTLVQDYKNAKLIPYPEYVYKLMNAKRKLGLGREFQPGI